MNEVPLHVALSNQSHSLSSLVVQGQGHFGLSPPSALGHITNSSSLQFLFPL